MEKPRKMSGHRKAELFANCGEGLIAFHDLVYRVFQSVHIQENAGADAHVGLEKTEEVCPRQSHIAGQHVHVAYLTRCLLNEPHSFLNPEIDQVTVGQTSDRIG